MSSKEVPKIALPEPFNNLTFVKEAGSGKSARVYEALGANGEKFAIKIYDPDLRAKYGVELQEERLQRELKLKGHPCRYLVNILGGGSDAILDGKETTFLVMEYVEGVNLRDWVNQEKRLEDPEVRKLLSHLFEAANYLLKVGLCHRDIKVDNIRIRANGDLVLLDLGVLKPIGQDSGTDDVHRKPFTGTLRYSPPELLHRRETDDLEGWTAITIYQIGTVLYEVIQGVKLFGHIPDDPYADLVMAVNSFTPPVQRNNIGGDLRGLTSKCLTKDPRDRLKLVAWDSLPIVAKALPGPLVSPRGTIEALLRDASERYQNEIEKPSNYAAEQNRKALAIINSAMESAERVIQSVPGTSLKADSWASRIPLQGHYVLVVSAFKADLRMRFPGELRLLVRISKRPRQPGIVTAHGLAISGISLPKCGEIGAFIAKWKLPDFELLYDEVFEQDQYTLVLADWVGKIIEKYFEVTKPYYEAEMKYEKEKLVGGNKAVNRSIRIMRDNPSAFTTISVTSIGESAKSRRRF